MDCEDIDILNYIPQRPPFVMVDRIVELDAKSALTQFTIQDDNLFLDEGELSASGLLENMAQSCAARIGCINCTQGGTVKEGVIGDIRDFKVVRNPRCHEVLSTRVEIMEEVFSLTLANVTTMVGDEMVASARIKIALV